MQSLLDLRILVDKYAADIPELNLDSDEQEEYSTMLLWLQNQVEGGTPNPSMWIAALIGLRSSPPGCPRLLMAMLPRSSSSSHSL